MNFYYKNRVIKHTLYHMTQKFKKKKTHTKIHSCVNFTYEKMVYIYKYSLDRLAVNK